MKRVKLFIFLLPALILPFFLPKTVLAETKILNVNQDAYANQAYPDQNQGGAGGVVISNKFTIRLGYVQFEDLDLPTEAVIDQAILKIYVYEVHYADTAKLNVGPVTGDWTENTITWNNKPTINQTQAIEAQISLTNTGWKEITITNLTKQWFEGTIENKGLFIYPYGFLYSTPETEYAFTFKTKESGDQSAQLEVTYHLEESPAPSPEESVEPEASPETNPSPSAEAKAVTEAEETPQPSPTESPSPSSEAGTESGKVLGIFSTGQALIALLIIFALAGAVISFIGYARKPKEKKKKKSKKEKEEEEEIEEENNAEEEE